MRPVMPKINRQYNGGVKAKDYSLIDPILGAESLSVPKYKKNLVKAVRESVFTGDDVVIVGGGLGVSAVNAYRESKGRVTYPGEITVFECSKERFKHCRQVFDLNDCSRIELRNTGVGEVKKKVGNVSEANFIHPSDLPECQVLELDCEGAEVEILEEMTIRPETIIVETHEEFDAPTEKIRQILSEIGYHVVSERPDAEFTEDNVLTAKYSGGEMS